MKSIYTTSIRKVDHIIPDCIEDMGRKVSNPVIKKFSQRLEDNEQFIQMCSEHNKKYEESDNDDID